MFKSSKFPTVLFVVASLATLILFGLLYVFVKIQTYTALSQSKLNTQRYYFNEKSKLNTQRYYFNENYYNGNSLITKMPTLDNILTGPIITSVDPNIGNINAPITIIEFSDYVCSFCQQQEGEIKRILEEYKSKVVFIWKDYPENNPSSISWQAAIAARCAGEQDKYWPYHDLLFSYNGNLSQESFLKLAQDISLNIKAFKQCLSNERVASLVKDNILEANALDINGVPFVYVNDREILGQVTYEELRRIVEIELEEKTNSK